MNEKDKKRVSKFLSLVLRHQPEKIGLELDKEGWASVSDILEKSQLGVTFLQLEDVVQTNDKKRFTFNQDKTKIRANQGHSLKTIDLGLQPRVPPLHLFHGTVATFVPNIKEFGLKKMSRQHVHMSVDRDTATRVGARRGRPVLLCIKALDMSNQGYRFFLSENGVWLTDHVPSEFIDFDG